MDAVPSLHPTDQTLNSYGLGNLDDESAEAVHEHLEGCPACRERVAGMSDDSFIKRVRDAQKPAGRSTSDPSPGVVTSSDEGSASRVPDPAGRLPEWLADHPDYQMKTELGRGGMGVVYLAHNTLMGRDEVLKVMGREIVQRRGVLERFLREIRAVAKLRHPNIVTAYSAVRLGERIVFAMEYVEGLDLSKMVKAKGPLPIGHACNFVHQAALGLQHAHEEGLVHRDIKPANLMLTRKGNRATVKVLDFGLAKAAREEKVDEGLTSVGQALGTPDFIAPEQIIDAPTADIRADIYSLGGTLYYLLAGRPPFKANSLYDMYQAHISREADPLNLIRPEVPAELVALVAKMMAKDPARRFQTPGEVARALTPFFTRASRADQGPKHDVSEAGESSAGRPVSGPAQPAAAAGDPARRALRAPEPVAAESRWESLLEFREEERSVDASPVLSPVQRPRWVWPSVALGVVMLGLIVAGLCGVFKVRTPEGVVVVEGVPKDSEIFVDGDTTTVRGASGGKPLEVRALPGQRNVEVKQGDMRASGEVVKVATDGSKEVTVRLEPLAGTDGKSGLSSPGVEPRTQAAGRPVTAVASAPAPDRPTGNAAVLALLERPVPMKYPQETPLEVVLADIQNASRGPRDPGIAIYVDPVGLQEAEKTRTSPIVIDREGLPLRDTLRLALRQLGLDYVVKDGLLFISDPQSLAQEGSAPVIVACDQAAGTRAILAKLATIVPMNYANEAPLGRVLSDLKQATGGSLSPPIPMYVDPTGLQEAEKGMNSPIRFVLQGVPLRVTLQLLLREQGLGYYVKDGLLVVTDGPSVKAALKDAPVVEPNESLMGVGGRRPVEEVSKSPPILRSKEGPLDAGDRAPAEKPAIPKLEPGWVSLFNGKDLAGWQVWRGYDGQTWGIEDEAIIARNFGANWLKPSFLISKRDYSQFVLRFQFQIPRAEELRFLLRGAPTGNDAPLALFLRRVDDHPRVTPSLAWSTFEPQTGDLLGGRQAELHADGKWNDMEIECRGATLRATVNSREVLKADLLELAGRRHARAALSRKSGRIGLHSHKDTVRFRAVAIKEIPGGEGAGDSSGSAVKDRSRGK